MKTNVPAIRLSMALLAIGLVTGCSRGPMPPTHESWQKVIDIQTEISHGMTVKEFEDGKANDEGKKAFARKLDIGPFEKAGYDLDATLSDFAVRLRDKNFTADQEDLIKGFLGARQEQLADLARWGFIKEETKNLVSDVLKQ